MTLFKSLTHRPFAFLWIGQTLSRLGDSVYRIALAWWILEATGSATAMGTVLIFSSVPMLAFVLIGGVAADRFSRSRVMFISDLLRGVIVTVISFLAFSDHLALWHVYAASMIFGLVGAFFQPAYTALVPEITPRESLPSANSLTSLSGQVVGIIGPALGAGIVTLGGTPTAFALDGLSFFVSAACLVPLLKFSVLHKGKISSSGVISDLREGIRAVLASPWLWITITIASLINITQGGALSVALPFLVKEDLHADVGALGLVYSMISAGSVIGAVWLGRLSQIRRRGLIAYSALILMGLMILSMGLPISLIGVMLAALILGLTVTMFSLTWTNTLQELVQRDLLGRVSSIDYLGSFVFLPVGYGIAGWATDMLGAPLVFLIGGMVTVLLALLGLAHPAIRELD